jgi:uncharacterized membrane protein
MRIRQALTLCLAALFPVFSYAAIRSDLSPTWLGLVDLLLFAAILIAARLSDGRPRTLRRLWPLAAGFGLCAPLFFLKPDTMIYFSPVGISLLLASLFLTTLSSGQEPLITRFARLERRGVLPDDLRIYTRRLTWAWAVFFCLLVLESVLLAALAPMETFLLFTNTVNYAFVGAFFVIEYIYRRVRYRHHSHPSILHLIATVARSGLISAGKN